jgi:prepilin-type N-terminal cleavage/methylation domain-containing protein
MQTFRLNKRAAAQIRTRRAVCAAGFTLIEMTVVMVLLALLSAVALPNFERWFSSTQQRVDASRITLQVQNLLARASILNQSIDLTSTNLRQTLVDGKVALDLPPGWSLKADSRLTVYGSGYCVAAEVIFQSTQKQQVAVQIRDQQCNVGFTLLPNRA